ncbi:olfactory receptor 6K2-like [Silurus meridionalis]|uniref:olfactory receptor 6K2-like n=1 Tax=Silurus meridionalis TaxID=175797 RepID=UPI001EEAF4FC|nr:olfactory receptor 6K2-like [Silurus meridionalis]
MCIIVFNTVVISVIFMNKHLHEPMYIFISALLCNALFGATALYPKLLSDLLSEKPMVTLEMCLFQAFFDFLLIPPLFNPIIYGLKLQEIWNSTI